jgi:hypothetical protein
MHRDRGGSGWSAAGLSSGNMFTNAQRFIPAKIDTGIGRGGSMTNTKAASVGDTSGNQRNNGNISSATTGTNSVADILERELDATISDWMTLVEKDADLVRIPLSFGARTGHLPRLLHDVIARLRLDEGTKAPVSVAASDHGKLRRDQGYTVAMVVDESRILQVCIFSTLHKHTNRLEFSKLLPDVVLIADEVDSQLKQQVLCFLPEGGVKRLTQQSPRDPDGFPVLRD